VNGLKTLEQAEQRLTPFLRGADGVAAHAFSVLQNKIQRSPTEIQTELNQKSTSKLAT